MADIKRLLNKKGWTGRELGQLLLANIANDYRQALEGNFNPTSLISEAESSITTKNNDTPTDNGDYSTDPYTSSVVRTTQTTGLSGFDKYEQAKQVLITDTLDLIFADFEKNFVIRR